MEKSEVPGNYLEISQSTGGEVYEIDDANWPFNNQTNELEDEIPVTETTTKTTTLPPLKDTDENTVLQQQVIIVR